MNYRPHKAKKLKVVKIGNSVGVVLPREVLAEGIMREDREILALLAR